MQLCVRQLLCDALAGTAQVRRAQSAPPNEQMTKHATRNSVDDGSLSLLETHTGRQNTTESGSVLTSGVYAL
jgi:hypothetical protein